MVDISKIPEIIELVAKIIRLIIEMIGKGMSEAEAVTKAALKFDLSESDVWKIWKNRK